MDKTINPIKQQIEPKINSDYYKNALMIMYYTFFIAIVNFLTQKIQKN